MQKLAPLFAPIFNIDPNKRLTLDKFKKTLLEGLYTNLKKFDNRKTLDTNESDEDPNSPRAISF